MPAIEYEYEFTVIAVNDGRKDYYLRLSRLIPDLNVVQLKKKEMQVAGRNIIDLGVRTDTVSLPRFMEQANHLELTVELRAENESQS